MFLLFFYLEAKWRDGRDAGRPLELEEVHLRPSGGKRRIMMIRMIRTMMIRMMMMTRRRS